VNSTHFRQRGVGLIEVMLALADAKAGDLNLNFDSTIDLDSKVKPVFISIAAWLKTIQDELDNGAGQITCDDNRCTVSIRWKENIDGTNADQFYHIAGLL